MARTNGMGFNPLNERNETPYDSHLNKIVQVDGGSVTVLGNLKDVERNYAGVTFYFRPYMSADPLDQDLRIISDSEAVIDIPSTSAFAIKEIPEDLSELVEKINKGIVDKRNANGPHSR